MTESSKAAAEKARETYRKAAAQFEDFAGDTQVPEAMRALAEKNIAQTREIYERSKDALDAVLESWERSFDAVGQGAVALNRKVIDIAQRNINSGFDLAKSLAAAKNLAEAMEFLGHGLDHVLDELLDLIVERQRLVRHAQVVQFVLHVQREAGLLSGLGHLGLSCCDLGWR